MVGGLLPTVTVTFFFLFFFADSVQASSPRQRKVSARMLYNLYEYCAYAHTVQLLRVRDMCVYACSPEVSVAFVCASFFSFVFRKLLFSGKERSTREIRFFFFFLSVLIFCHRIVPPSARNCAHFCCVGNTVF